jgi:hypothetical protein
VSAPPLAPRNHYQRQRTVTVASVAAARAAVRLAAQSQKTWSNVIDDLVALLIRYQTLSTRTASGMLASAAGDQPLVPPTAFAGQTAMGYPLADPLTVLVEDLDRQLATATKSVTGQLGQVTDQMLKRLDRMVASEVTDAGREATHVEIIGRPQWENYVRVLNLPSCKRCVVLAGRIYRDLDHFDRHPQDDCEMWPVKDWGHAHSEGLVTDPVAAIKAGKVAGLSEADHRAIVEDGADPSEVINATRGTSQPGVTAAIDVEVFGHLVKATTAGTSPSSAWRREHPNLPVRMRPGSIYEHAKDRDHAVRLLKLYGYLPDDHPAHSGHDDHIDVPVPGHRNGDTPTPVGGSAGGDGRPPTPGRTPAPDPDDSDREAWKARQEATGLDFGRDQLEPHEVRTVERLLAQGERIRWIPQDRRTSTSDFVWESRGGLAVEMKSTAPTWGAIHGRIVDAASRAWRNHRVVKDNFLIDIGDHDLPTTDHDRLAGFNLEPHSRYKLRHLWVMSRGRIDEIPLRA